MTTVEQEALTILDGMESITRNEMLTRGTYVTEDIIDLELAEQGAICGGRQACMVGSMWLAAGVKLEFDEIGELTLPGVFLEERQAFLEDRPALAMAYYAMNSVSHDYIIDHNLRNWRWDHRDPAEDWMEALFEAANPLTEHYRPLVETQDLLHLIVRARMLIKSRMTTAGPHKET